MMPWQAARAASSCLPYPPLALRSPRPDSLHSLRLQYREVMELNLKLVLQISWTYAFSRER